MLVIINLVIKNKKVKLLNNKNQFKIMKKYLNKKMIKMKMLIYQLVMH